MHDSRDHFFGRHYDADHSIGPFAWLNPTRRYMVAEKRPPPPSEEATAEPTRPEDEPAPKVVYVWRSRDNRKGRHAVAVDRDVKKHGGKHGLKPSNTLQQTLRGIGKMFVRYPVWDISYDVAVVFTIGSVIWVFNGFFSWLPLQDPSTEFPNETGWAAGLTAIIGATVFEFGSVLLMLEAVNENRADCFGWAVEDSIDGVLKLHQEHGCKHSHAQKGNFITGKCESEDCDSDPGESSKPSRVWSWWPTWYELRTHYFHEIGFLACFSQMVGASIFWIAGITSIPPILNNLSVPAQNGVYWATQVIGGTGFIVSSTLFMIEVQPRWYIPAPRTLGWHIGLWNLIGAIGFTLCGALGFGVNHPGVEYALTLSSFIGSWAFLVGSAIQWFESLDKYPIWVEEELKGLTAP